MNLKYLIPNKMWWIENFLPDDVYKGIHNAIIKDRKNINLMSAEKIWDPYLAKNMKYPERVEVKGYPPFEILKEKKRNNKFFKVHQLNDMKCIIHFMRKGAGINWHDDGGWKYGATYYINHRWNIQWGGEFMFASEAAHGFLPLVGNSLVIAKTPFQHKVNPVLSRVFPRISVQIFMK